MNSTVRRVAVLGGSRIPFARQNGPYAKASNQDMLTTALNSIVEKFGLEGERLDEVAATSDRATSDGVTPNCPARSRLI